MQIAQVLAGYTLGGADLLRRAMGKKIQAEMDAQRAAVRRRARRRAASMRAQAEQIFDQMAKFAGYGFNKSHAAAYALVAYQTAYLKANHPVEFLAASMTFDLGNTDKLNISARNWTGSASRCCRPTSTARRSTFSVEARPARPGKPAIRYALAAVKGVGAQAMARARRRARAPAGRFKDLFDFAAPARRQELQPPPVREPGQGRRLRKPQPEPGAELRRRRSAAAPGEPRRRGARRAGQDSLFGGDRRRISRRARHLPVVAGLAAGRAVAARIRGDRLLPVEPPARPLWQEPGARRHLALGPICRRLWRPTARPASASPASSIGRKERTSARGSRFAFVQLSDTVRHLRGDPVFGDARPVARPARRRPAADRHRRCAAARRTACA